MRHRFQTNLLSQIIAVTTFVLVCTPAANFATAQARSTPDAVVINKFIKKHQSEEDGFEAEDAERTRMAGDLNQDGIQDVAVLYMLEGQNGTNNDVQHLAIFLRLNGRLVPVADKVVGGRHYRTAELKAIKAGVMYFDTLDFADDDAWCCPSIKGSTKYVLVGRKLREIRQR